MNKRDYYEILGVSKNATDDELKKAYRKLAREHHPDVASGDKKAAEQKFKEINEAYQVLGDPQKKKSYDQFGHAGTQGHAGGQGPFGGGFGGGGSQGQWGPFSYSYNSSGGGNADFGDIDPFDVFESFFGSRGFGGNRRPKKGKDLHYEMRVDFVDAVRGAEKEINVESGKITVRVPAGADDGTRLKFASKGMPGPDNLPAGDLYITLRVATPKDFQRFGENLGVGLELSFVQAILGDEVSVPVIDPTSKTGINNAKMKIPEGTQHGAQIRLKGKGMPRLGRHDFGDVIVQVFVSIPKKISKKQKELLEQYKTLG